MALINFKVKDESYNTIYCWNDETEVLTWFSQYQMKGYIVTSYTNKDFQRNVDNGYWLLVD